MSWVAVFYTTYVLSERNRYQRNNTSQKNFAVSYTALSCFICLGMEPDLTYYHNSSLPLKNFLYIPQRKITVHFATTNVKMKTFTLKKISYVSGWMWTKHKIFDTLYRLKLLINSRIKTLLITGDNCLFSLLRELLNSSAK